MLRRDQSFEIDRRYLSIAALPVLVFAFGEAFISTFGVPNIKIAFDAAKFSAAAEAGGRYVFFAMFSLFVAICITVFSIFLFDTTTLFKQASRTRLYWLVAVLGGIVLLFIILGPSISSSPKTYWFGGSDLFDDLFTKGKIAHCTNTGSDWDATLKADSCTDAFSLKWLFIWMLKTANLLIAVAAGSAVAGAISCLGTTTRGKNTGPRLVTDQVQRLNQYLYLGAALMVCGMLLIMSWLHWPDSYFSGQKNPPYSTLTNGLTIYYGINYSLIIFSYYAPVALILSHRATGRTSFWHDSAKARANSAAEKSRDPTVPTTFRVVFALLSPFLTGLFGTLINLLSGGFGGQ